MTSDPIDVARTFFGHWSANRIDEALAMLPVMGTLTIEDGLITLWRDYFDPTDFDRQLAKIER